MHHKEEFASKRFTRKYLKTSLVVLLVSVSLVSCGGSSSSSQDSTSESKGSDSTTLSVDDINVEVECGPWTQDVMMEADCDIAVENTSSASGSIYVEWDWQTSSGGMCMGGFSRDESGPIDIEVEANQTGVLHTRQAHNCRPFDVVKVANLEVTVIE